MTKRNDTNDIDPLDEILKRHGVTDPYAFLEENKNVRIVDISREEVDARLAGGVRLFWFRLRQRFSWLPQWPRPVMEATCSCDIEQVRTNVKARHDRIAEEVANDLPGRR